MTIDPATRPDATSTLRLFSAGPDETRAIGSALAGALRSGDLVVLDGDLGAGKTCFTQGLGVGLGITEPITSPTFTLANRYRGRETLHHLDAYRLDGAGDAADLDLSELVETGITVVEWGQRIAEILPTGRITITLRYPDLAEDPDPADDLDQSDHRLIEIDGPLIERGIDRRLAPWVQP